jgi:hypothetical protein
MVVPDSSPRAFMGVSVRIPQMLTLADGTFFPWLLMLFRGAALADCGSSPRSLAGAWVLLLGFLHRIYRRAGC